jgi:hypothetical protein
MFVGDDSQNVAELRDLVSKCRKQIVCPPFPAPTDLADKLDLMVVNFDSGKKHDPKALFYMGVADATGVPVLLLEGNSIPYPPLLGLARRVLFGECRFEQAIEYLSNLGSQHISDEALVYYDLMKKFNK